MIRRFALNVFDKKQEIVDRFVLENTTEPAALGFSLSASTIKTDTLEIVVQLAQELNPISFNVIFNAPNAYQKANVLRNWIESNASSNITLEYQSDNGTIYCDTVITQFDFTEADYDGSIIIPLTLKPLTPFWRLIKNQIIFYPTSGGKSYPYTYPFRYGRIVVENNVVNNSYIKDIPLILQIHGPFNEPIVNISDEFGVYGTIELGGVNIQTGQVLIIDSIRHKVELHDGKNYIDYYDFINPEKQTFLFAKAHTQSKLSVNFENNAKGKVTATYRQYKL